MASKVLKSCVFLPQDIQFSFTAESTFSKSNTLHPTTSNHRKSNSLVNPVTCSLFVDNEPPSHKQEAKPNRNSDSGRKKQSKFYLNQANNSAFDNPAHGDGIDWSAQHTLRLNGRNLIKNLNEINHKDAAKLSTDDQVHKLATLANCTNLLNYEPSLVSGLSNDQAAFANSQPPSNVIFESPVKRKCIIKNYQKPRFNQWKSYWLQLVGGNVLIYYATKSMFIRGNNAERKELNDFPNTATNPSDTGVSSSSDNSYVDQQHLQLAQLQSQLQCKKVNYHKNPCKMHPIASWMVVNLFQDKENEMIQATRTNANAAQAPSNSTTAATTAAATLSSQNFSKFDIQLNDLNNGNMYKYRFDSLQLAKEWHEQFKLASTYHERQKPDNLIKFD